MNRLIVTGRSIGGECASRIGLVKLQPFGQRMESGKIRTPRLSGALMAARAHSACGGSSPESATANGILMLSQQSPRESSTSD